MTLENREQSTTALRSVSLKGIQIHQRRTTPWATAMRSVSPERDTIHQRRATPWITGNVQIQKFARNILNVAGELFM